LLFDLPDEGLPKDCCFLRAACVFQVSGPDRSVILEIQANGILIAAMPAAVDDFSAHRNLIRKRSDINDLAWLPLAIRNHARTARAHVVRVATSAQLAP